MKIKLQGELQKYLIENGHLSTFVDGQSDIQQKTTNLSRKETMKPTTPVKQSSKDKTASTPTKSTKSPLKPQTEVQISQDIEKKMAGTIKRTTFFSSQHGEKTRRKITGVVFRFQQGFTCAVRQPATVSDFL